MFSIVHQGVWCNIYATNFGMVKSENGVNELMVDLTVIGGGLAGSEAAWQAAERGINVRLFEMRPMRQTGAHKGASLAELVCSNSLGSNLPDRSSGLLKEELRLMGSLLLQMAEESVLPAGGALAVDRDVFAEKVTRRLSDHPRISIIREEATSIPDGPAIICSGPLTSPSLSQAIRELTGKENLAFFDALAPIVNADSINMQIAYRASRYTSPESGEGDYINCPFDREQYDRFVDALKDAEQIPLKEFESEIQLGIKAGHYFESCLPAELMARRGEKTLAFGPMRPLGLTNPHTGKRPYAVMQLRQDNLAGSLYNLVGFQTNLTYPEQQRVFRLVPGLEKAQFVRYGQMHRNTFIASPVLLNTSLQLVKQPHLFFAGQISGMEGYMGNIGAGLWAALNAVRHLTDRPLLELPVTVMAGALIHYITHCPLKDFQPMKANYGILPPLETPKHGKRERAMQYRERSLSDLERFIASYGPL